MKTLGQKLSDAQEHQCQTVLFLPTDNQLHAYCKNKSFIKFKGKWTCLSCYNSIKEQIQSGICLDAPNPDFNLN